LKLKILFGSYLLVIIGLFFYSFTQVDLGLTLTEWSIWQVYQKFFQYIGYFQRPLSASLYAGLLVMLSVFYILYLYLAQKNALTYKHIFGVILSTSIILLFSYNAFSHDLFNYIFDAKIVTFYNQNPYEHKALDYAGDPMLGFMHWTHRTYPYGPIWLLATVPLSFLGFGFLLPTIMLFKALIFASYIGLVYAIKKILQKVSVKQMHMGMLFFALNPLVLIEGLVSAHNDIFMLVFALWAFYALMQKRHLVTFLLLGISIGVKFATIFLLPIFIFILFMQKRNKKISWDLIFITLVIAMIVPIFAASIRTSYQPWYLLYVLPFAAIVPTRYFITIPVIVISIFSVFEYLPFLYLGNWDPPVPTILLWIREVSIVCAVIFTALFLAKSHFARKR